MEPLSAEDLQELRSTVPNFEGSYTLQRLASKKLLPQQNDLESFERPSFPTQLRRMFFGHTKKENQLIKRQEEELAVLGQEQEALAKFNAQQQFLESIAPSYQQAGQQLPGFQRLAPFQTVEQPASTLIPANEKGFQDMGLLPGTLNPDELPLRQTVGFVRQPGTQVSIPLREPGVYPNTLVPIQEQNPTTRLSPAHARLYNELTGQPSTIEPETGALVPLALAKPRLDLISREQLIEETELNEQLGNVPPGTTNQLKKAPLKGSFPKQAAQQALAEAARRQLEMSKVRGTHTLDDTAIAVTGHPMSDIAADATVTPEILQGIKQMVPSVTGIKVGDNLKKAIGVLKTVSVPTSLAGTKAAAQTAATQATSLVSPEKQSNYIHAPTFAETGKIIYPQSTVDDPFTQAKAATGGWKEITDKQKESIRTLDIARSTQGTLFELAHQLIKAKGPAAAFAQGLRTQFGAFIRSNPLAAAFMGDREAFSGWMARMVEVGVLTQQDVTRWASVLPDQRDTVGSAIMKEAVLNMLFDAAELANRRAILGDIKGLAEAKKSLHDQVTQAAKLYAHGSSKPSAQELYKDEFGE